MTFMLPAYLEFDRDLFKATLECNYAEFKAALARERDYIRRTQLNQLLRLHGSTWRAFPQLTVEEMIHR